MLRDIIRELHLVARTIYTLMSVFALMGVTGLFTWKGALVFGPFIFISSFVFQYYVLHEALKSLPTPRGRLWFLIGWLVFVFAGLAFSGMMIPSVNEVTAETDTRAFSFKIAWWSVVFVFFSSLLVATTCARRAFTRYGALG